MSNTSRRVAIVTDSTADLPEDQIRKYGIIVVPQYVVWGDETLQDIYEINSRAFFDRLITDPRHPGTSQPPPADFAEAYRQSGADEVVCIVISDLLSGSYPAAQSACEMVEMPVRVVDSKSVTMGLGMCVLAAARAAAASGDAEAAVRAAQEMRDRVQVLFTVDTLEYLHRGGRIGGASRLIGTALNIKPLLHIVNGRIEPLERIRTRQKALARMIGVMEERLDTSRPVAGAVMHGAAPEDAQRLAEEFKARFKPVEFCVSEVTPIVGVHSGPGVIGIIAANVDENWADT
jgi:DegV family protein with EDD domain